MGFGAEVAAVVQYQAFDWLDAPVERVGAKFAPLPFAPVMEEFVVPHAATSTAIMRTVRRRRDMTLGGAKRRGLTSVADVFSGQPRRPCEPRGQTRWKRTTGD